MSQLHRNHPEATPEEIDKLALAEVLHASDGDATRAPEELRSCRDCGTEFYVPAGSGHGKWHSMCAGCLQWEL